VDRLGEIRSRPFFFPEKVQMDYFEHKQLLPFILGFRTLSLKPFFDEVSFNSFVINRKVNHKKQNTINSGVSSVAAITRTTNIARCLHSFGEQSSVIPTTVSMIRSINPIPKC
jgi:hypothetical protein